MKVLSRDKSNAVSSSIGPHAVRKYSQDVDKYTEELGQQVVDHLSEYGYIADVEITDEYIVFNLYRDEVDSENLVTSYIQPLDEIEVNWDDIERDTEDLTIAILYKVDGEEDTYPSSDDFEAGSFEDFPQFDPELY